MLPYHLELARYLLRQGRLSKHVQVSSLPPGGLWVRQAGDQPVAWLSLGVSAAYTSRGQVFVCHVARIRKGVEQGVRNFVEDEGRPLEVGAQAQASNHLKLRGSRARVVSVEVKRRSATLSGRASRDERK
jgi:hypothetical protein